MDIGFVVMGHPDPHNMKWFPIKIVYTKNQIETVYNRYQMSIVSSDMFYTLQGLKYNNTFKKYISLWRKELRIPPNGLSDKRYFKIAQECVNFEPLAEGDVYIDPDYGYKLFLLEQKYRNILQMHHYLRIVGLSGYNNWELLVLYGIVEPILEEPITWELRGWDSMFSSAQSNSFGTISINLHRKVTRYQIVKFVNTHFEEIEKMMKLNLLPALPKEKILLSREDIELLALKERGLSYNDILNLQEEENERRLLAGEIKQSDIQTSSRDSLRVTYQRIRKRINTLFREVEKAQKI